jgi:hypothetical protein
MVVEELRGLNITYCTLVVGRKYNLFGYTKTMGFCNKLSLIILELRPPKLTHLTVIHRAATYGDDPS